MWASFTFKVTFFIKKSCVSFLFFPANITGRAISANNFGATFYTNTFWDFFSYEPLSSAYKDFDANVDANGNDYRIDQRKSRS